MPVLSLRQILLRQGEIGINGRERLERDDGFAGIQILARG